MASTSTPIPTPERLRSAGLRVTAARMAVLEAVDAASHVTAEDIASRVRERIGAVSTQAVYDALRACTSAGLMRRIEPAGHPARYETRVADNHHHMVCRHCGRIEDVDCAVGEAPCLHAPDDHGFVVDEAELVYWGACPDCRSSAADDSGRAPPAATRTAGPDSTTRTRSTT